MNKAILPIFTGTILFGLFIYIMYYDWSACRCDPKDVCQDGNGCIHHLGRKHKNDEIQDHLDRIDWVVLTNMRTNKFLRSFAQGFLISFFIFILMWRDWPTLVEIFMMLGIATLIGLSTSKLYEYHADIYPIYYIRDNIKAIREKLELEEEKEPKPPGPVKNIPHTSIVLKEIDESWEKW